MEKKNWIDPELYLMFSLTANILIQENVWHEKKVSYTAHIKLWLH